jgi:hypothetical protein
VSDVDFAAAAPPPNRDELFESKALTDLNAEADVGHIPEDRQTGRPPERGRPQF